LTIDIKPVIFSLTESWNKFSLLFPPYGGGKMIPIYTTLCIIKKELLDEEGRSPSLQIPSPNKRYTDKVTHEFGEGGRKADGRGKQSKK
jgi:hypothetical protein